MSDASIARIGSTLERTQALISRADSLICTDSMERARAWIEAGIQSSLDPYRSMTFGELIEAFPGGRSMAAEIVETADRLDPGWSQGSSGEIHLDYVAFRLREACEACLGAQTAGAETAAERAKYLRTGLAAARIEQLVHEALDDSFSESDHLSTVQGSCGSLRDAVHRASDCPRDIDQYVRDLTNICQHWRSRVRSAAQYLHRSLPALKRLASGDDASAKELADMAIIERLMDDYAETRLKDPSDPSNDPDLAARKAWALEQFLAQHQPKRHTDEGTHITVARGQASDHRR